MVYAIYETNDMILMFTKQLRLVTRNLKIKTFLPYRASSSLLYDFA